MIGVALFAFGCAAKTPREDALRREIAQLQDAIEAVEANVSKSRRQTETLAGDLEQGSGDVALTVSQWGGLRDSVEVLIPPRPMLDAVSQLVTGLGPPDDGEKGLSWRIQGTRFRLERGRISFSGSYFINLSGGICQGPLNGRISPGSGHTLYPESLEVQCASQGRTVTVDIASALGSILLPIEVAKDIEIPEGPKFGVAGMRLRGSTSLEIDQGWLRVFGRNLEVEAIRP